MVDRDLDSIKLELSQPTSRERSFDVLLESKLIGVVSLICHGEGVYGLGYWVGVDYTGHSHTTQAVRLLIKLARQAYTAKEIWAGIKPNNLPRIEVEKRLGFELARAQDTHLSYKLVTK